MTTVDQKAITWLDNMYQKFEAKAVEDIIQDSVKYVENQVQTVGACVEKLYSELVQNLLPVPSGDPGEPDNPGLRLVHCADNEICDKSELDVNKVHVKVGSENLSSDSHLAAELDEYIDDTFSFSASCNKDESEEKLLPSQESVPKATPIEGEGTTISNLGNSSALLSKDDDCKCTDGEGKTCNEMDESHEIDECIPSTLTVSSSSGPTIFDESVNDEDVLKTPNDMSNEHMTKKDMSNEPVRERTEIDDVDKEVLQVSEQQLAKMKLGESCVLVDKHEHFSVPRLEVNQSSYKKKIRDVFHLKRWSRSKNHEQLNTWLEDTDSSNERNGEIMASASTLVSGNTNLESNYLESGWEIV